MAESKSGVLIVLRLNAIVNEQDLRVAILGSVQNMGFDSLTENQTSAIEILVRGHNVFISLPTGSGKLRICKFIPSLLLWVL